MPVNVVSFMKRFTGQMDSSLTYYLQKAEKNGIFIFIQCYLQFANCEFNKKYPRIFCSKYTDGRKCGKREKVFGG